jgi:hypothetical protein
VFEIYGSTCIKALLLAKGDVSMINLNKEFVSDEEVKTILEEISEREEFHCTGYVGCPANGCSIDDVGYLSDLNL